jgi:4-diphosphocytidyl-2-C-methyl-D-erythritol kinase
VTVPSETAYAKLNLALHVRAREPDGYHAIETLFAFCADGDRLERTDAPGLVVDGPFAGALAGGGDNLVTRAAAVFADRFGVRVTGGFRLHKALPVAAGIGGGSADAAAALRLLARAHHVDPAGTALLAVAAALGADVPACLLSVPTRGTGRGDRLVPLVEPLPPVPVLLVNPRRPLATGPVFAAWDGADRGALPEGEALAVASAARNDLEAPARRLLPVIGEVVARLAAQPGVRLARMSGSGATCFALFEDEGARDAAARAIAAAAPDWWLLPTRLR